MSKEVDKFINENSEQIIRNLPHIYDLANEIKDIDREDYSLDMLIKIYNEFYGLELMDSTIKNQSDFYKECYGYFNPLMLKNVHEIESFLDQQYYSIQTPEELNPNLILLVNRYAKVSDGLMDKIFESYSDGTWQDEKKIKKMFDEMYQEAQLTRKKDEFDYIYDLYFNDDGTFLKDGIKEEFKEAPDKLFEKMEVIAAKYNFELSQTDLYDLQNYSMLRDSQNIFYNVKANCVRNCIELAEKAKKEGLEEKIVVKDCSELDNDNDSYYKLLRIDLSGYNAPFLQHVHKDVLKDACDDLGIEALEKGDKNQDRFIMSFYNFKLTEQQRDFVEHAGISLYRKNDSKMEYYKDTVGYLLENGVKKQKSLDEKIRKQNQEFNGDEVDKSINNQDIDEIINQPLEEKIETEQNISAFEVKDLGKEEPKQDISAFDVEDSKKEESKNNELDKLLGDIENKSIEEIEAIIEVLKKKNEQLLANKQEKTTKLAKLKNLISMVNYTEKFDSEIHSLEQEKRERQNILDDKQAKLKGLGD